MRLPKPSTLSATLVLALLASAVPGCMAAAAPAPDTGSAFHLNLERTPVRHVDLSPFRGPVSSQILAGPANGLDSAFVVYTRMAAGTRRRAPYALPGDHTYLVLAGTLNVQLGTDDFEAKKDTLVLVPAGTAHQAWNAGPEQVNVLEVITPADGRDLQAMMKPAQPHKLDNAAQYIRVAPPLGPLKTGTGHDSQNERVLADRDTGSDHLLERLDDVAPGGGIVTTHIHPFDQLYFVTGGSMGVQYGLGKLEAPANSLVILHAGTVHSNRNSGNSVESHVTLLLPEPPKGVVFGSQVDIKPAGPPPPKT